MILIVHLFIKYTRKAECESLNATLVNIETDMELTFISCKLLERDGRKFMLSV